MRYEYSTAGHDNLVFTTLICPIAVRVEDSRPSPNDRGAYQYANDRIPPSKTSACHSTAQGLRIRVHICPLSDCRADTRLSSFPCDLLILPHLPSLRRSHAQERSDQSFVHRANSSVSSSSSSHYTAYTALLVDLSVNSPPADVRPLIIKVSGNAYGDVSLNYQLCRRDSGNPAGRPFSLAAYTALTKIAVGRYGKGRRSKIHVALREYLGLRSLPLTLPTTYHRLAAYQPWMLIDQLKNRNFRNDPLNDPLRDHYSQLQGRSAQRCARGVSDD